MSANGRRLILTPPLHKRALVITVGGSSHEHVRAAQNGWTVTWVDMANGGVVPSRWTIAGYDLLVVDCSYWGADPYATVIAEAWADCVSLYTTGNDTTALPPLFSGVVGDGGVNNAITPAGSHSVSVGWPAFNDGDLGNYLTGLHASAVVVGTQSVASVNQPEIIAMEDSSTGARWVHVQPEAGTHSTELDAAVYSWLVKAAPKRYVNYFNGTSDVSDVYRGWATNGFFGTYAAATTNWRSDNILEITWPGSASRVNTNGILNGFVIGARYTVVADVWVDGNAPDVNLDPFLQTGGSNASMTTKGSWVRMSNSFTAATVDIMFALKTMTTPTAGTKSYMDNIRVYRGGSATASASSSYGVGWEAFQAFDGLIGSVTGDGYAWASGAVPAWLQAQVSTARVATGYTVIARNGAIEQAPRDWTFLGSNDGTTWTTLNTQTAQAFASDEAKTYTFTNSTAYSYYRINITACNGSSVTTIGELIIT